MRVKALESIIAGLASQRSLAGQSRSDIALRFRSLRRNGLLGKTPGQRMAPLSNSEIIAAVLSVVPTLANYAGLSARVLMRLRPVGGKAASFMKEETFGEALSAVLSDDQALNSVLEVRVSDGEIFKNAYGHAEIHYRTGGRQKTAFYVPGTATSLFRHGVENLYDPSNCTLTMLNETIFRANLFQRIVQEQRKHQELKEKYPNLADCNEVDEEDSIERKDQERRERLGITPRSHFLNVGVANQVTWPKEETLVEFDGYYLVLMPKTRRNSTSVHIDLYRNRLSGEEALTVINRFLSMLTWCDDQHAINHGGWSGSPIPVAMPKPDLAFTTAYLWAFDRRIPESEESRKAIAIYREARNAEESALIGYAVLGYYKIVELRHKGRSDTIKWFARKFERIGDEPSLSDRIQRFLSSKALKWESKAQTNAAVMPTRTGSICMYHGPAANGISQAPRFPGLLVATSR